MSLTLLCFFTDFQLLLRNLKNFLCHRITYSHYICLNYNGASLFCLYFLFGYDFILKRIVLLGLLSLYVSYTYLYRVSANERDRAVVSLGQINQLTRNYPNKKFFVSYSYKPQSEKFRLVILQQLLNEYVFESQIWHTPVFWDAECDKSVNFVV